MPILKLDKINNNAYWCMWEITETVDELKRKIILSEGGIRELESISHMEKKKERLAARCCVQALVRETKNEYLGIMKDAHDKPYLIDYGFHISISHSFPFATAILHKKLPVGIDIEKPQEKLKSIANRFLNDIEYKDSGLDVHKLCVYWTGKEAIFKLNGKKGLNFKRDIRIFPFEMKKRDVIRSEFILKGKSIKAALNYREMKGHIISYCF